ncbi:MAG: hypothetical protein PHI48_06320 [Bacteroidales bacterium]|nr:hypothetical protein [Bacteroidales bacterium]
MIFEYEGQICCVIAQDLEELSMIKNNLLQSASLISGITEDVSREMSGVVDILKALEFSDDQYADIQRALKESNCKLVYERFI